jgi:hypothetical protein
MDDVLSQIQKVQFSDRVAAEAQLLSFVRKTFALDVAAVEVRPLAVSLNSLNGYLTLGNGKRLFFKTHSEPDSSIDEYYNTVLLAKAGYPILEPVYRSTEAGRQFLIYELVQDPTVFDVAWRIENGDVADLAILTEAQERADRQLFQIYQETLALQTRDEAARAPIHQLFHHRLAGGRLEDFYGAEDSIISLPGLDLPMSEVWRARWTINGQRYVESLKSLVSSSLRLLDPAQAGPSIIGHGDAHNGNVFLRQQDKTLRYFDPAFAGRHDPLMDLAKPIFHNVFAMWMYFPAIKRRQFKISVSYIDDRFFVEHDYLLPPVRMLFLKSKVRNVLIPILTELRSLGLLRTDWRRRFKAELFCCPLLTMSLTDQVRFPLEISLLGLTSAVEMGAESLDNRSLIDITLDEVEEALSNGPGLLSSFS